LAPVCRQPQKLSGMERRSREDRLKNTGLLPRSPAVLGRPLRREFFPTCHQDIGAAAWLRQGRRPRLDYRASFLEAPLAAIVGQGSGGPAGLAGRRVTRRYSLTSTGPSWWGGGPHDVRARVSPGQRGRRSCGLVWRGIVVIAVPTPRKVGRSWRCIARPKPRPFAIGVVVQGLLPRSE